VASSRRTLAAAGRRSRRAEGPGKRSPGGAILINPATGKSWAGEQVQPTYVEVAVKRIGLRHRSQKQTHHRFATICRMSAANPAWVARQCGYVLSKMLFEVYSRWIEVADKSLEHRKVEAWIGPRTCQVTPVFPTKILAGGRDSNPS
jgi:hypothetical protein